MRQRYLAGLFTVVGLLFVAAIWFDLSPLLRGPDEWRWNLRQAQVPDWQIVIPLAALAIYVLLCVKWLTLLTAKEPADTVGEFRNRRIPMRRALAWGCQPANSPAASWNWVCYQQSRKGVSP